MVLALCACATPSPRSVADCNDQTVRGFWESLQGDTVLLRHWHGSKASSRCREGDDAASCEARARAGLARRISAGRPVHGCISEPGGTCLVVRHDGEVSTVRHEGNGWDNLARALWGRWGRDEVELLTVGSGEARTATASAPREEESARFRLLLRAPSATQARAEIKRAAGEWPALKVNIWSSMSDPPDWLDASVSCRPKDKPHPSTHTGPWHCLAGPSDPKELSPNECYPSEKACASGREELMDEVRFRGGRPEEIGTCSAAPRVHCYAMKKDYSNLGAWQSYRSYFCFPTRERCEKLRPEHPWHASVESACFEAGSGVSGGG
ncbi:hypothetical protein [Polyangium sp. 15x6]|uniref:hypothetical protein n=1 Tax=Polyangium sp. 15x6 TaxID=3042687 RepID=UPI00249BC7DC|nr:hypothetical protein [Polyangium sp. 15x6]MDI3288364.1 hypothetical protein [Polyangium sp. 15x6]